MDEEPDFRYLAGEMLPGGLKAIHTPGPEQVHYAFWRGRSPAVLFCPDLIMRDADGDLAFIPAEYHDDPQATARQRAASARSAVRCALHGPRSTYHRKPARGPAKGARLMCASLSWHWRPPRWQSRSYCLQRRPRTCVCGRSMTARSNRRSTSTWRTPSVKASRETGNQP